MDFWISVLDLNGRTKACSWFLREEHDGQYFCNWHLRFLAKRLFKILSQTEISRLKKKKSQENVN